LSTARPRYDAAIIGAGPAGAACAIALQRAGVERVCVLDSGRGGAFSIGETIPPDTHTLLDDLGLWEAFLAEDHEPCLGSCSSWGGEQLGFNDFLLNPHGPGWHLDRERFDDFLRAHAMAAGAELCDGVRFVDAESRGEGGYRLRVADEAGGTRSFAARFVVDATGRASAFARQIGATQLPLDRLTFLYGFFDSTDAASSSRLTLLEAAENGWWYAAALPGNRLAVAFATDAECVRELRLHDGPQWLAAALRSRHLSSRLHGCRFEGSVISRVAASFILSDVADAHWLAAGDAAACFDPLAAQGIYKAIADGISAARHIAAALDAGGALSSDFSDAARAGFNEYLENRNYFYDLEQRWPRSRFWHRRQSRTTLATVA
jgi:flavin-dependent dehydrogenase